MDDENESSKSAGLKNSNLEEEEEDKISNKIENSSVHNDENGDDDRVIDGSSGAESLRESKTGALISETLAHPNAESSVQIEIDGQSEFDSEFSPSYQLSGTIQCRLIRSYAFFFVCEIE